MQASRPLGVGSALFRALLEPGSEPGKVVLVLQKGYLLHDKLLRPAMVQVGI